MNKAELIEAIAGAADLSKASAARALDAMLENVVATLCKEEDVILIGFGTFTVSQRAARSARNPQTGAIIQIPATKAVRFKAGKAVEEAVNGTKK